MIRQMTEAMDRMPTRRQQNISNEELGGIGREIVRVVRRLDRQSGNRMVKLASTERRTGSVTIHYNDMALNYIKDASLLACHVLHMDNSPLSC